MEQPRIYSADGIILKRKNVGEADRILTMFAKQYGKIRVLAKGVRKITSRRSSHVELFRFVHVIIHRGKTFDMVSEAETIKPFEGISDTVTKIHFAYYLCELVDHLTAEAVRHDDIVENLTKALDTISKSRMDKECTVITTEFAVWLVKNLGFIPPTQTIVPSSIPTLIEHITERKFHTPRILRKLWESRVR